MRVSRSTSMVRHIRPAAARVRLGWALTLTLAVAAQAQSPVSLRYIARAVRRRIPDRENDRRASRAARAGAAAVVDPARDEGVLYTMEQDQPERTLTDALPKDGNGAIDLPRGGPDWGDVQLLLNYSTSAAGSLRCEIQDGSGKPIPGFALDDCDVIYGDHIERPVAWAGRTELKSLVGKPVKLKFELKDADLYAIRFGQAEQ